MPPLSIASYDKSALIDLKKEPLAIIKCLQEIKIIKIKREANAVVVVNVL